VHVFDSLTTGRGRTAKRDPRRKKNQTQIEEVVALTWAASQGDLNEVRALVASGVEPGTADYDGRTALHLAAAEGQLDVVRYLLACGTDPQPVDRWGGTPLSDAESNGHTDVAALLGDDRGVLGYCFEEIGTTGLHKSVMLTGPLDAVLAVRQVTARRPLRGQGAAGQPWSANGHAPEHQHLSGHLN